MAGAKVIPRRPSIGHATKIEAINESKPMTQFQQSFPGKEQSRARLIHNLAARAVPRRPAAPQAHTTKTQFRHES